MSNGVWILSLMPVRLRVPFSHISVGGWNFASALILPAGDTNTPADTKDPRYQRDKQSFSFHVFGGTSGRLVFRDIFLDGSTFLGSHSTGKKLLVGDFVLWASLIYRNFKFACSQILLTREFDNQSSGQNFGSISLSYSYQGSVGLSRSRTS